MIELSQVSLRRGGRQLFADFCWQIPDPGNLLLCGPSGSGKSLVTQMLAGRLRPQRGQVAVDGEPLYRLGGQPAPRVFYAMVAPFSEPETLADYWLSEVAGGGTQAELAKQRFNELTTQLTLKPQAPVAMLSRGELALVEIALATVMDCRVLVLDGHLQLLDEQGLESAAQWLAVVSSQQDRFVILTAQTAREEYPTCHSTVQLKGGLPVTLAQAPLN